MDPPLYKRRRFNDRSDVSGWIPYAHGTNSNPQDGCNFKQIHFSITSYPTSSSSSSFASERHEVNRYEQQRHEFILPNQDIMDFKEPNLNLNSTEDVNTVVIDHKDYAILQEEAGQKFIELLKERLGVVVHFDTGDLFKVFCNLEGPFKSLNQAKNAIIDICYQSRTTNQDCRQRVSFQTKFTCYKNIENNFDRLKTTNISWFVKASNLYEHITHMVDKIKFVCCEDLFKRYEKNLREAYAKLNTILIVKLQIGKDKEYVEILQRKNSDRNTLIEAFNYVFNSERIIYPDYKEMINKLKLNYDRHESEEEKKKRLLEQMKRKAYDMCVTYKWKDRYDGILHDYILVIINNYSPSDVQAFRKKLDKLQRDFLRSEKIRRKRKRIQGNKPSK